VPPITHIDQFYDMCVLAKHHCGAFPKQNKYRMEKALELVHGDLCGPVKPATPGERRYILLLVDDATRYMWVAFLAAKSEATGAIRRIQEAAEECGRNLRVLRIDNGRSSRRPSSPRTTLMRESSDTSRWWSGGIRRWW
jgi:hypothetical protein